MSAEAQDSAIRSSSFNTTKRAADTMKRDQWSNNIQFFTSIVSTNVGLGNVWRFPYLCYINGGGAFLLPYLICVILGGVPILFLEVSLGQFMGAAGAKVWDICPLMRGIGVASLFSLFWANTYYIVILAWALMYFFESFTSVLPWSHCDSDWNTVNCFVHRRNITNETNYQNISDLETVNTSKAIDVNLTTSKQVSSVIEFWEHRILRISDGIDEIGSIQWDLALCLLLLWIIVLLCISKGIKSAGKVMYFTSTVPIVLLFVLLIRGVTLPGSLNGVIYYLLPDINRLTDLRVWADAGSQVFYSSSLCSSMLTTLGSYNKFHHNCYRDCILFACVNCCVSFLAGFVIFSTLGFMAFRQHKTIAEVAESGPGLAFIAYPQAVSEMPLAPLWAVVFFFMILLLGIGSLLVSCEAISTGVFDQFPTIFNNRLKKLLFNCFFCVIYFLFGLLLVSNGGMYYFQLLDFFAFGRMVGLLGFLHCLTIAYFYGVNRYYSDLTTMLGYRIGPYMKGAWLISSPVYTLFTLLTCIIMYTEVVYNRTYMYPTWSVVFGWCLAITPVVFIPVLSGLQIMNADGTTFKEKLRKSMKPKLPVSRHQDEYQKPDYDEKLYTPEKNLTATKNI